MAVTADYIAALSSKLNNLYSATETQNSVVISVSVRSFIESLIIESLLFSGDVWLSQHDIDCEDESKVLQTIPIASEAVQRVLTGVTPESYIGVQYVSVGGILDVICRDWCGIFPLCKGRRRARR